MQYREINSRDPTRCSKVTLEAYFPKLNLPKHWKWTMHKSENVYYGLFQSFGGICAVLKFQNLFGSLDIFFNNTTVDSMPIY